MPTLTKYTYSVSADIPAADANLDSLTVEIGASSIVTALDHIDRAGDVLDVWFKDALSAADKTTLDNDATGPAGGIIGAHTATAITEPLAVSVGPEDDKGRPYSIAWPTQGTRHTSVSPNWCDPTTWYENATRVVDETLTDSGDGLSFDLPGGNRKLIDTYHGKIIGEDFLLDGSRNSFRCEVKDNGTIKTEQDPHIGSGGDYTIDYETGRVTFAAAPTGPVTMTYHYSGISQWTIKPKAGKVLNIKDVEVQFSQDVDVTDTIRFEAYGLVEVFAPQLTPSPYPAGTLIPLGNPTVYKTMMDYIDEANGALPAIPSLGGASWRGMSQPIHIFPWRYQAMTRLESSKGMEVRISLEHDTPFGGTVATATFYCLSEDE